MIARELTRGAVVAGGAVPIISRDALVLQWRRRGAAFHRCAFRPGAEAYQLVVLYPDGSEETERFEGQHELLDAARELGKDLSSLGWEPCPTAAAVARRES